MKWRKLGLVYGPDGSMPWAKTHAIAPTPVLLSPRLLRVYCGMCADNMVGRPAYVDLDPENPLRVLGVSKQPLLDVGEPGAFDENGVVPCSVVPVGDRYYMYYVGFELGTKIRYRLLSGLAVSNDGGNTFTKIGRTPVLERSDAEFCFRGAPFALWQNNRMRMWYVAGNDWTEINGKKLPVYSINYIESPDGKEWPKQGRLALAHGEGEHGLGRPWVVQRGPNDYQLYFSIRKTPLGGAYRFGYAESSDGLNWVRKDDEMGLDVTPGNFDSDAIMYATPITVGNKTWCFYNGNNFGREGFAVAELVP